MTASNLLLWLLLCPVCLLAQTPTAPTATTATQPAQLDTANGRPYYLLLRDGSSIRGRIIRRDSIVLTVRQTNGQLTYLEPELLDRIVTTAPPQAPDPAKIPKQQLTLRDSSTVIGRILTRTDSLYTIELPNGQTTFVETSLISKIGPIATNEQEQSARFSPFLLQRWSVVNPRKGSVYYRNSSVIQNELVWGITNYLSVGITYTPVNWSPQGYVNSLRYSAQVGVPIGPWCRLAASVGYVPYQNFDFGRYTDVLDYQALIGFGDVRHIVTLAYGWQTNGYQTQRRYIRIGANLQLARRVAFVMDNTLYIGAPPVSIYSYASSIYEGDIIYYGYSSYAFNRPLGRMSLALRLGNQKHTFDAGVMASLSPTGINFSDYVNGQPYFGYSLRFGQ